MCDQIHRMKAMSASPVYTDGTEVENGGCAQHHIHRHQSITDEGAEWPHPSKKLHCGRRAHRKVRHIIIILILLVI